MKSVASASILAVCLFGCGPSTGILDGGQEPPVQASPEPQAVWFEETVGDMSVLHLFKGTGPLACSDIDTGSLPITFGAPIASRFGFLTRTGTDWTGMYVPQTSTECEAAMADPTALVRCFTYALHSGEEVSQTTNPEDAAALRLASSPASDVLAEASLNETRMIEGATQCPWGP